MVPCPGAVSMLIVPPCVAAKRCATLRPSSMPLLPGLAVKNASAARPATAGGMPVLVSHCSTLIHRLGSARVQD